MVGRVLGFSAAIQHPAVNAKVFGRKGLVAVRPLEDFGDDLVLQIREGLVADTKGQLHCIGIGRHERGWHVPGIRAGDRRVTGLYIGREVCGLKGVPGAEEQGPLDEITQFAHVAGKGVATQDGLGAFSDRAHRFPQGDGKARHELFGEGDDVFAPFPQRRRSQGDHVQSEVQIFAILAS